MNRQAAERYRSIWTDLHQTSFRQGWVDAGGVNTRFAQAGSEHAPAVIMLHGTAGSWDPFSANLGAHARHFNCYAIDMVGSGLSDKPDKDYEIPVYVEHLRTFMKAVGLESASLLGVSLGSWVAARFALTYPAATEKLTLMSAAGMFANDANMDRIRSNRSKAVDDPSWANIKVIFDKLIRQECNRIGDVVALRQSFYRQPNARATMEHVLALQDPVVRRRNLLTEDEWRRIGAPTLLIGAVDDPDEYLETARRASKLIPNARYLEMRNVNHWPHFEDPDTFNRLNIEFLLGGS